MFPNNKGNWPHYVRVVDHPEKGFEYKDHSDTPCVQLTPDGLGCTCTPICTIETCQCIKSNPLGIPVDSQGRLLALVHDLDFEETLFECGPGCLCRQDCCNRITSGNGLRGRRYSLLLKRTERKGLGVFADCEVIPKGSYICEYAGEYLRGEEAKQRLANYDELNMVHALLVFREILPSGTAALKTFVDATNTGSIARFFNHSCDGGNLESFAIRRPGCIVPCIAFFTKCNVHRGQELTFAYGSPVSQGKTPCFCGTRACLGYLPHEVVS